MAENMLLYWWGFQKQTNIELVFGSHWRNYGLDYGGQNMEFGVRQTWVQILTLPLPGFVIMDKSRSVPQPLSVFIRKANIYNNPPPYRIALIMSKIRCPVLGKCSVTGDESVATLTISFVRKGLALLLWAGRSVHLSILTPISYDLSQASCADSSKEEAGSIPSHLTLLKPHSGGLRLLWLWNPCSFGCRALQAVEGQFAMAVCICSRADRLGEEGVNVFWQATPNCGSFSSWAFCEILT